MNDDDRKVTVCAACKMATCWQGIFMCQESQHANVIDLPISELKKLDLEHPSYWSVEHLKRLGIEP